eukprot:1194517-Pleurochrysis_carterae.AAC.2
MALKISAARCGRDASRSAWACTSTTEIAEGDKAFGTSAWTDSTALPTPSPLPFSSAPARKLLSDASGRKCAEFKYCALSSAAISPFDISASSSRGFDCSACLTACSASGKDFTDAKAAYKVGGFAPPSPEETAPIWQPSTCVPSLGENANSRQTHREHRLVAGTWARECGKRRKRRDGGIKQRACFCRHSLCTAPVRSRRCGHRHPLSVCRPVYRLARCLCRQLACLPELRHRLLLLCVRP